MTVTKKRKSIPKSVEKFTVQNNVCSNLKAVYSSRDEESIKRGVRRLVDLFTDLSSSTTKRQFFLDELRFRLDFLIDNKAGQTARVRCLRALALCAIQLMKNGDLQLLDFLVDYCKLLCNAESQVFRQYICLFVGLLYQSSTSFSEEYGTTSILPVEHYRELFVILRTRWIDTSSAVRREAIRSLSFIQQDAVSADHEDAVERSPSDMLMTSLGDCAPECREEAVKCLVVTEAMHFKLILNVAQRDSDVNVKRAALNKLLSDDKFEEVSSRSRMEILEHLFGPSQQNLKDEVGNLLIQWVKSAALSEEKFADKSDVTAAETQCEEKSNEDSILIGTLHFLRNLDIVKKETICEKALAMIFRKFADKRKGFANFVSALTDSSEECVQRNNYKTLILESGNTLTEKTLLLFHWRVLIELCCVEYEKREDQKSICLFKLVPTLNAFTEFVAEFVDSYAESQESPFRGNLKGGRIKLEDSRQFCLLQLFRIFHCLDREPVGMNSWKKLLFSVLSNPEVRLGKPLVKLIVESLMHFHFPTENEAEPALHEFCDVINSFVQTDHQVFNASATALGRFSPSRGHFVEATPASTLKMDEPTRERSLLILNAMLRSGFFKEISAELQGLCESILPESFGSQSVEVRSLALECLGVYSLRDDGYAKIHICLVKQSLDVDLKAVKLICITVLTDLVIFYGYTKVARWFSRSDDADDTAVIDITDEPVTIGAQNEGVGETDSQRDFDEAYSIFAIMMKLSTDKDPDISFSATECLCKWCLSPVGDVFQWRRVVQHLLLLSVREEYRDNTRMKACISRFMPIFAATSRRNQMLLAEVFISAMNTLKDRDLESELTTINENLLASRVINLTSFCVLAPQAVEREKGSAHSHLAKMVLSGLKANVDDYFAGIYCKVLAEVEINEALEEEELNQLLFLCTDVFQVGTEANDEKKNMRLIQQFMKRLTALRDKLHTFSRPTSTATRSQKAAASASTRKAAGAHLRAVETMADMFTAHTATPAKNGQQFLLGVGATKRRDGTATPLKATLSNSDLTTPHKRTRTAPATPRTSAKKTTASIAALTSELSINKSARRRRGGVTAKGGDGAESSGRATLPTRIARRPVMKRAAKEVAASAYRPDDTIVEEEETVDDGDEEAVSSDAE